MESHKVIASVTNPEGLKFNVTLRRKGDRWGLGNVLTHTDDDPIVVFWVDSVAGHNSVDGLGYPCSSYYLRTVMESAADGEGIGLEGSMPEWWVSAGNVADVVGAVFNTAEAIDPR